MNYQDTEDMTIQAVKQYYKGNMEFFYLVLHPQAVVLSVGKDQLMVGKDEIMQQMQKKNNTGIRYDVDKISCKAYAVENRICHTVLESYILTYYPDQTIERVNQRVTVLWKYFSEKNAEKGQVEKAGWYAMNIHISVALDMGKKPENAAHFSESKFMEILNIAEKEEKIVLRDIDSCTHYVPASDIIRFEADNHQVIVFLKNKQKLIMSTTLNSLETQVGKDFVRVHRSHMVNVKYVQLVKNYKVTMVDGSVLPIPKEKYTNIKKTLANIVL
ncbi:MAG: LytTR family DNA-binding domain-containing protein [Lachnospiraceae bacterium]|nr:LytTR family DNA-binding domain-containing protein [Lachnospiraceae bacterium]